jgi:DNA-binding CsgD family transcriptional regulator
MPVQLRPREVQFIQLAGRGLRNDEIADALGVAVSTVANGLSSAYAKLEIHDRRRAADRIGILLPGAGFTDAEIDALLPDRLRPAATPAVIIPSDARPWLARVWRRPPGPWKILALILMGAVGFWVFFSGGIVAAEGVFAAFERLGRSH